MPYNPKKSSFPYGAGDGDRASPAKHCKAITPANTDLDPYPYFLTVSVAGNVYIVPEMAPDDTEVFLGNLPAGTVINCGARRVTTNTTATVVGYYPQVNA